MELARGAIYEIEVGLDGVVSCRVWRDANVDDATGARCAAEMLEHLRREALDLGRSRPGFVFDVREGPPAFGPRTEASLTELFALARARGRAAAVIVGKAMQELQFGRLCREVAPGSTFVTRVPELAREFVVTHRAASE